GGRVSAVVSALIAAKGAGIDLAWDETISRDIAGRDVFGEVMAVTNQKNVSSFSPAGKKY
ncbi:MAG: flotillin-like FloA family protein, partial [Pyrinomonadaceae bacterium]|nr:flotillin-like FloA family protein [Phycisphaerales bacterium]